MSEVSGSFAVKGILELTVVAGFIYTVHSVVQMYSISVENETEQLRVRSNLELEKAKFGQCNHNNIIDSNNNNGTSSNNAIDVKNRNSKDYLITPNKNENNAAVAKKQSVATEVKMESCDIHEVDNNDTKNRDPNYPV